MTEHHPKYQIIAAISGIFTILGFSHLIFKVYKTKATEHLTYTWIFSILTAQSLLVIYGIINNYAYGIYLPQIFLICVLLFILYTKITYEKNIKIENELKLKNILTN
jgi:uncharacterized protein with PQ loop repeat